MTQRNMEFSQFTYELSKTKSTIPSFNTDHKDRPFPQNNENQNASDTANIDLGTHIQNEVQY